MYEPDDKMILLIKDNYNILQTLSAFGISLGFGDKSVRDVCETQNVDTYTFLAVVNFAINGYRDYDDADRLSIPTLIKYLKASHEYFLDFQLQHWMSKTTLLGSSSSYTTSMPIAFVRT